ncbi:DUF4233 domain-containing protein [Georgenia phoenicis]|uniref:DUF4233 domain-containing protein n=1 Tax=unclassified Georgenia TaxID=2626815 RepID=UPI0039B05918
MSRRPRRSARALFTATLLLSEALVVLFAGLVAYGLRLVPVPALLGGGAALAVWAVVAGALVRRGTVGYVLGSLLQLALIATGFVVPMMFGIGGVFAVLWLVSLRVGGQIDAERVEREDAEREYERLHGTGGDAPGR